MKWIVAAFVIGFLAGQFSQDKSIQLLGYRLGIGTDGYALQSTADWHVVSQGWFPWHKPHEWTLLPPGNAGDVLVYKDGIGTWQRYEPNDVVDQKDEAK